MDSFIIIITIISLAIVILVPSILFYFYLRLKKREQIRKSKLTQEEKKKEELSGVEFFLIVLVPFVIMTNLIQRMNVGWIIAGLLSAGITLLAGIIFYFIKKYW